MKIRTILPSLATLAALGMLAISVLFLQEALNQVETNRPKTILPDSLASTSNSSAQTQTQNTPTDLYPVINRPLFSPSRRVPEAEDLLEIIDEIVEASPPQIVEPPSSPAPEIVMIGILEDGGRLMALVRSQNGVEQWVEIGTDIGGWGVVNIAPRSITLQLNGESVDIYTVD